MRRGSRRERSRLQRASLESLGARSAYPNGRRSRKGRADSGMKIGLFGGTFDPVHLGHLAVARAATEKFDLARVYFVPADLPPHKQKRKLTDFQHRFAMLALATAEDQRFVPSLLDAPAGAPNYSVETVRRLKS